MNLAYMYRLMNNYHCGQEHLKLSINLANSFCSSKYSRNPTPRNAHVPSSLGAARPSHQNPWVHRAPTRIESSLVADDLILRFFLGGNDFFPTHRGRKWIMPLPAIKKTAQIVWNQLLNLFRDVMLFRNVSCTKAAQVTQRCQGFPASDPFHDLQQPARPQTRSSVARFARYLRC